MRKLLAILFFCLGILMLATAAKLFIAAGIYLTYIMLGDRVSNAVAFHDSLQSALMWGYWTFCAWALYWLAKTTFLKFQEAAIITDLLTKKGMH